jgi:hypothetical protein
MPMDLGFFSSDHPRATLTDFAMSSFIFPFFRSFYYTVQPRSRPTKYDGLTVQTSPAPFLNNYSINTGLATPSERCCAIGREEYQMVKVVPKSRSRANVTFLVSTPSQENGVLAESRLIVITVVFWGKKCTVSMQLYHKVGGEEITSNTGPSDLQRLARPPPRVTSWIF